MSEDMIVRIIKDHVKEGEIDGKKVHFIDDLSRLSQEVIDWQVSRWMEEHMPDGE